jgi:hypothetical protein
VIQKLVPKALLVIHNYLTDPSVKASDRLRACHIIGNWAGLNQSVAKSEPQAETQLKDYLNYLSIKNADSATNQN